MTDTAARVAQDLERVASEHGDITDAVYERFFSASEEGRALMGHSDQPMRGRMLQQTLELFCDDAQLQPGSYLDWELDNHLVGYRATPAMYESFLSAIVSVVTAGAAEGAQRAWLDRQRAIMARVEAFDARENTITP